MKFVFEGNYEVDLTPTGKTYRATLGEKTLEVEILRAKDGKLDLLIDGKRVTAYVSSENAKRWVTVNGQTRVLTKPAGAKRRSTGHEHASELAAPMPGQVRAVNVSEGDAVTKGQNSPGAGGDEDGNPHSGAARWHRDEVICTAGPNR